MDGRVVATLIGDARRIDTNSAFLEWLRSLIDRYEPPFDVDLVTADGVISALNLHHLRTRPPRKHARLSKSDREDRAVERFMARGVKRTEKKPEFETPEAERRWREERAVWDEEVRKVRESSRYKPRVERFPGVKLAQFLLLLGCRPQRHEGLDHRMVWSVRRHDRWTGVRVLRKFMRDEFESDEVGVGRVRTVLVGLREGGASWSSSEERILQWLIRHPGEALVGDRETFWDAVASSDFDERNMVVGSGIYRRVVETLIRHDVRFSCEEGIWLAERIVREPQSLERQIEDLICCNAAPFDQDFPASADIKSLFSETGWHELGPALRRAGLKPVGTTRDGVARWAFNRGLFREDDGIPTPRRAKMAEIAVLMKRLRDLGSGFEVSREDFYYSLTLLLRKGVNERKLRKWKMPDATPMTRDAVAELREELRSLECRVMVTDFSVVVL